MYQLSIFDGEQPFKIDKPIRLITLFSGYDSQALALRYLGVPFEHYRTCEWAIPSIQALHDLHFAEDTTDYSDGMSKQELVAELAKLGISADYNEPLSADKINRYGEQKLRIIYNNIKSAHNMVSIVNAKGKDLGVVDTDKYCYIMTYSFPCFTADSLVLTDKGYKKIIDIQVGDLVLTHDNTYQKVVNTFDNGIHQLLKIRTMAADEITCTPNHKLWVRTKNMVGHKRVRTFSESYWKPASALSKNDYLGIAINQNAIIPKWDGVDFTWKDGRKTRHKNDLNKLMAYSDFWWIIGRYIGDGWCRTQGGIVICCAHEETEEITSVVGKYFKYTVDIGKTATKVHIALKELSAFVEQFGKGALKKHLNNTIIDLPRNLLKAFIEGYMSADGCKSNGLNKATSISKELIYGLAQCVAKVYMMPYRIYFTKRPSKYQIQGRVVNQHDTYQLVWKDEICKQDKAFYEEGHIWCPIKDITEIASQNVYDIEVEKNHSFTVQNIIVHNCQDLSNAGLQKGMDRGSGTRSGLLWEVERLLKETAELPQVLLMENVPQVIGKKNIGAFAEWIAFLDSLGYHSKWEVINATDYAVPQNRKRCFMVSVLGDHYYNFPNKMGNTRKLRDLLEDNVSESYYLSERLLQYFIKRTEDVKANGGGFAFTPTNGEGVARTVQAGSNRMDDNYIIGCIVSE